MKHDHSAFKAAQAYGQSHAGEAIVEERIRNFLPMVRKAAWHIYGAGREGLEVEDLIQAGLIALTQAARKHAGPGEDGFAAYAKLRVRGAMFDYIRKLTPEARGVIRRRAQLDAVKDRLEQRLRRAPSAAEICAETGLSPQQWAEIDQAPVRIAQLDSAYDDTSTAFADDTADPFALLTQIEDSENLLAAIKQLPERLQLVLQLYFVEELNLSEIAAVLEVSVPRVHQIKAQAISGLRKIMA